MKRLSLFLCLMASPAFAQVAIEQLPGTPECSFYYEKFDTASKSSPRYEFKEKHGGWKVAVDGFRLEKEGTKDAKAVPAQIEIDLSKPQDISFTDVRVALRERGAVSCKKVCAVLLKTPKESACYTFDKGWQ